MKLLGLHDVLAVAAHVLRRDSASVVQQTDLDAVEQTLAEVRDAAYDDPALAAAALLSGLVRRRPFPALNRTIAVACTLQLLALNGCDLRLERSMRPTACSTRSWPTGCRSPYSPTS